MTGGFIITFREGLEAFLVVGIILSCLNRMGLQALRKWVFAGVGAGVASAFALALAFQLVVSGFDQGAAQVKLKIAIMAFAVVMLTYVLAWMSRNSKMIKSAVEKDIESAVSRGSVLALVLVAYFAILREGFETVLFLGALYGSVMDSQVLTGALLGIGVSLAVSVIMFKGLGALPVKSFFRITSVLVLLIAGGLLVNMVGMMGDLRLVPAVGSGFINLSWLMDDSSQAGIFFKALFGYTSSPSLTQVMAYISYMAGMYFFVFREAPQPAPSGTLVHAG